MPLKTTEYPGGGSNTGSSPGRRPRQPGPGSRPRPRQGECTPGRARRDRLEHDRVPALPGRPGRQRSRRGCCGRGGRWRRRRRGGSGGSAVGTVGRATVAVSGAVVGECGTPLWVATSGRVLGTASASTMAAVGAGHRDQQAEQHRPDPVTRDTSRKPLLPCAREPAEDAARGPKPLAAFEAVLLIGAVWRAAPWTLWPRRRDVRRAHCSQRSCVGVGSASSNSACGSTAAASDCWAGVIAFPQTRAELRVGRKRAAAVRAAHHRWGRRRGATAVRTEVGAPHERGAAGTPGRRRCPAGGDRGRKQRVELLQALVERDQLVAALDQQVLPELVPTEHLQHETPEVA